MAIWQFPIYFIPLQALIDKYGFVPTQLEMNQEGWTDYYEKFDLAREPEFEDAMTIQWWLNLNHNFNKLLPILQQFGKVQEWTAQSEGFRKFGDTETNDISVGFDPETNLVQELSCRLDVSKIDEDIIKKILAIGERFDCLLMDTQGRLYEPNFRSLLEQIKISDANRFVEDPRKFFEEL
jgi:hypothetical protein